MSFFTALITSKIAAGALAAGALAAGGTAAAAYTGSLPDPLQQGAHSLVGAPLPSAVPASAPTANPTASPNPSPRSTASPTASPDPDSTAKPDSVGPDATGPAAFGLCTAFKHGGLDASSSAYASLAKAANGAANITAYCAKIPAPGNSGHDRPSSKPTPGARGHGDEPSSSKE